MAQWNEPTGITVAEGTDAARAHELAAVLAGVLDLPVSTVHLDTAREYPNPPLDDPAPAVTLAAAISAAVGNEQLLVVESAHADRWRSRNSVTEHLIDAHSGVVAAIGPASRASIATGPIVVALDGSERAQAGLAVAEHLAVLVGRPLVLATVLAEADAELQRTTEAQLQALDGAAAVAVEISNDPVSALVSVCQRSDASLIALASSGDRKTPRTSMSRTTAGLIAEAPCPVVVAPYCD